MNLRVSADEFPEGTRFDVNDISFLFPLPKTQADADNLISLGDKTDAGDQLVSQDVFDKILVTAETVQVEDPFGTNRRIRFRNTIREALKKPTTWKIAGIRIDPSAPGINPESIATIGSIPQIRLVVQPVTSRNNGRPEVHDITMHVVFNYTTNTQPPFVPNKNKFKQMLADLLAIKQKLKEQNVSTAGALDIHPGFQNQNTDKAFRGRLKTFLKKHLAPQNLSNVAFMGLDFPEPWIFFIVRRQPSGEFQLTPLSSAGRKQAQMFSRRNSKFVLPEPTNRTFRTKGVSTASLFSGSVNLDALVFPGDTELGQIKHGDIPDIIANPGHSSVLNTDCVSCHTESGRRIQLSIDPSSFAFKRPQGVSGVKQERLPVGDWNVRNFGWGLEGFNNFKETIALRTANEAAETAEFINQNYFSAPAEESGPSDNSVTRHDSAEQPKPVMNGLTLVMTLKNPEDADKLKRLIKEKQPEIDKALKKLDIVHFARFVFLDKDKLAVITVFDGEFENYILLFVEEIGDIFNVLLKHMEDAPTERVQDNPEAFLKYVKKNDIPLEGTLFSAFPKLRVSDIRAMQKKANGTQQGDQE